MEQSPTAIAITDTYGNIEYGNPKFVEITGYSLDEVLGKNSRILKTTQTDPSVYTELWKTITSGNVWQGEFINRKKNGEHFIEHAIIAPIIDNHGKIINYIALKEDITIKKQNELKLQESENKLKELNDTKDKLFAIIGHDLRGPIANFKAMIKLLITRFDLTNKEQLTNVLNTIHSSINSTYYLLENLLAWSKNQRNITIFDPQQINLHNIVVSTLSLLSNNYNKKNITIKNNIPANQIVFADYNMLTTIIRNLIANAIKFTPNDKNIYITISENIKYQTISIKDEGVGIPPENINKLFLNHSYFTTFGTAGEKGTGLGLSICKEYVEKHEGKIWVESKIGEGSTFTFTLPIAES